MKIKEHELECDNCGKVATKNLQNNWHLWEIRYDHKKKTHEYIDDSEWEAGENGHYCDSCYDKEVS